MSYRSFRNEILEKAEAVDEETWQRHVSAFIKHFVVNEKRHRWRFLCIEKPEKAWRHSHKMYNDLIWTLCSKLDYEGQVALTKPKGKGVYYDFSGQAWWLSPADAFSVGHDIESIFSMEAGVLAIYFWHESEDFICKR